MDIGGFDSSYAAMYYPWIKVMDPATDKVVQIPPSGHMAGIWSRSDNTRGVHKAPANEVVQGAVGLSYQTTKGEQDTLNPNGVNCIRAFPGRGIRVWGARTLSSDPAWRYINVRRLFNFVEKSIENGTQWVVFEPNDRKLWARVKRDVSAFLRIVWRDGALFGSTAAEAFYVKVDDELNPPEVRDLGRLIIEIGLAPVKPAEFVIFRISQWAGPGTE
jgi:phage tail sheath protein FI